MKYIAAVIGLLFITGCVHSSTNSAPVNIVGLWKGTIDKVDSGPPLELTFNFVSDGQNIGGFMRNEAQPNDWIRLDNFLMKGEKIYFTTTIITPQGVLKYTFKGGFLDSFAIKLAVKLERPGSSDNTLREQKPSFRYGGMSGGGLSKTSNSIDQNNPGNIAKTGEGVIQGMKGVRDFEFTIRKVE